MATKLDETILATEKYLDIAMYGVARQNWFFDSLDELKRSVRVRAVIDQRKGDLDSRSASDFSYKDTPKFYSILPDKNVVPDQLNGVPRAGSIMHNKFIVFDRKTVWLGSTNISYTGVGAEYNANTSLFIHSKDIALLYANEFYQMNQKKRFSTKKLPRSSRKSLRYKDGTKVSVYFSPQDNALEAAVLPFIRNAEHSLQIGMFYLTDARVAHALVNAKKRGVKIEIIYDALAAAHPSSVHQYLRSEGIHIRVENWGGKMHMKTAVADGMHTLMGSMNWSLSGSESNDENTIVIKNNPVLAGQLSTYFYKLWDTLTQYQLSGSSLADPHAESFSSINSCYDGLDNNHDGKIDAEDPGCN